MEISEREYLELKRRVEMLESKQKAAPSDRGWAFSVKVMPHDIVRAVNSCDKNLEVYCDTACSDAWKAFSDLAKYIHRRPTTFVWEFNRYHRYFSWNQELYHAPKRYHQLTEEQKLLSLDMLNELIPIYNKYYALANPTTTAIMDGEQFEVPVDYDYNECKF